MELVKRGYGLFSIALTQEEADSLEQSCKKEHMLSEDFFYKLYATGS
ncbi:unnamed protein product [marine sediment metagenome]|uniref:Uncharacterized protein n=1 Tax=marine sediment metagenome TaxID=412755 RepID=X1GBK4_9ZZZZ